MSVRITDLPEATELNGSELMPIVQNGVTRRTTLDFVNQAAPAALILQQTQQVLADTQQVLADTQQVKADTDQVLVNTEGVYNQTVTVQGQVEISIADWETQYLGAKSDRPTTDNGGNPLHNGALYWDTSLNAMFVWSGTSWTAFSSAVASVNGQIDEVVLDYADVGAANSGANDNITSMSGVTGDIGSAAGLQFNTLTPSATAVGKLTWNPIESTLDLGLNAAGVVQQIGQEVLYTVRNTTGAVIPNGSSVRVIGTEPISGRLLVAPAAADGSVKSQTFLGLTTGSINPGEDGFVTHFGKVRGVNTTGALYGETWVAGDVLYAHPATPGGLTKTAPQAPRNVVLMALVIEASLSGTLLVRPTYGGNFQNSESVALSGLAEGDVLWYSATQGRFENRTLTAAGIEAFGTAADSMAAHLAASDPHPQYTTSIEAAAAAPVQSVAGKTGAVSLAKADVGLGNVDNTSDANKPVSTAVQTALDGKENTIAAGTTSQYWRGDKSWSDFFTNVRSATLTGLSTATNAIITATDTVLSATGKLQAQVTGLTSSKLDVASPSFSGNAATATKLQTARTINGTSFDGTANITTANWGTPRTLTIGNTGKSVNGSANVSWSLAEIGVVSASDTTQGIVELATTAEVQAGTDNSRAVTPAGLAAAAAVYAPPGMVAYFARNTAPPGWLKANGAAVSRTTYAALFAAIGTTFGAGDGSTTFNLPDLRGEFIRGWDDGRGVDSGRSFGSWQTDEIKSHRHKSLTTYQDDYAYFSDNQPIPGFGRDGGGPVDWYSDYAGGPETRPRNVALLACIKY